MTSNKPDKVSNPPKSSEPSSKNNSWNVSEPLCEPIEVSPLELSNPHRPSEPILDSNPFNSSESADNRNPNAKSEPFAIRNPLNSSEPSLYNISSSMSEPFSSRNPRLNSEPQQNNKSLPTSEPCVPRNPNTDSEPTSDKERIRNLVEIYYDVQEVRMRSFNRLRSVGEVKGIEPEGLLKLEKQIRNTIQEYVDEQAIWSDYLCNVKGIGTVLGGGLISYLDPHEADHISSFWRYCGLAVMDGKIQKKVKGKRLDYNPKAKVLCWKIGDSFLKQRTPYYRDIYDKTKVEENNKLNNPIENAKNCPMYSECMSRLKNNKGEPKLTPCKAHIHNRALRKMVKMFLSDLWTNWRKTEGLPVSPPYIHRGDAWK